MTDPRRKPAPDSPSSASAADDAHFMRLALEQARVAADAGEVPVGAVLVVDGKVVAARGNERERRHDPTAHAEMLALREAAESLGGWRLREATLYVTLEPCAMCAGAIVLARVKRLVYGPDDPKAGATGSVFNITDHPALNHHPQVRAGFMAEEGAAVLRDFFEQRRDKRDCADVSPSECGSLEGRPMRATPGESDR